MYFSRLIKIFDDQNRIFTVGEMWAISFCFRFFSVIRYVADRYGILKSYLIVLFITGACDGRMERSGWLKTWINGRC